MSGTAGRQAAKIVGVEGLSFCRLGMPVLSLLCISVTVPMRACSVIAIRVVGNLIYIFMHPGFDTLLTRSVHGYNIRFSWHLTEQAASRRHGMPPGRLPSGRSSQPFEYRGRRDAEQISRLTTRDKERSGGSSNNKKTCCVASVDCRYYRDCSRADLIGCSRTSTLLCSRLLYPWRFGLQRVLEVLFRLPHPAANTDL